MFAAEAEMVWQAGSLALSIEILPLITYPLYMVNTFSLITSSYYYILPFKREGKIQRLSNLPKVTQQAMGVACPNSAP